MKKKKLNGLKLNKVKIADLNELNGISGGTAGAETRLICPGGDTSGCNTQLTACQTLFTSPCHADCC